jgi:PST family polysaccharide transporter
MHIAGILSVTTKIATSVFALTIALSGGSIELSLLCLPIISLIQLFIILRLARRKFGHIRIARSFDLLKKTFKELIPFGMTDFLFQVYSRTDVVLIGFMLGESASGIYNVGFRIIFFLLFIPNFAALAIFPTVSQLYKESRFEFTKMYNNSLGMLVMIGLPISAGVCLIAPQIIHMLFGPEFNKSALILEISSVIFLSKCINNIMTIFLMSCDRQKKVSSSSWIVTVFSVITLPVFIYFWNIEGAAFGVTLSSILFSVLLAINLKPVTGYPKIKLKALISISGVAAFYIVFMFFDTTIFIIIPGAIIIYLAVLLLFKPIRDNELKMILNLLNFQKNSLEHS